MTGTSERAFRTFSLALNTAVGTTAGFGFSGWSTGTIYIPAGSSITSLTFHGSYADGEDFTAMYDASGTAVVKTVAAGRNYPLPPQCEGQGLIKIVTNAAGTVQIALKS